MKIYKLLLFFIPLCFCSSVFAMMHYHAPQTLTYDDQIHLKVALYKRSAYRQLAPDFRHAGLKKMPDKLALLVFKADKRLELWGRENKTWKHIKNFPILAASGHPGPKLKEFDRQVPEGIYRINALNPNSLFHLSMRVNYPNKFDQHHAVRDGRKRLGGDIYIHGSDLSIGCIAVGDKSINELFVLAYEVGIKNIKVIIAPNDLRREAPLYHPKAPRWTQELYAKIKTALTRYPLTSA